VNLRQILLGIAISLGLTLTTVSHAQSPWWRWWHWHDTTAPTAPTGLNASAIRPTTLTLSWNAATDNVAVTGYNVYVNGALLLSSSSTSVQITELTPDFTRSFTVAAFDAAGNVSAPSAPLSVTTTTSVPESWDSGHRRPSPHPRGGWRPRGRSGRLRLRSRPPWCGP